MRLLYELRPVDHLEASVDYYRELGLEPVGWPDDDTAVLAPRNEKATIVLVRDPAEAALGCGGVYAVGDVDEFFDTHRDLDWLIAPTSASLGRYAVFADRTGACIRLLDEGPHPASASGHAPTIYAIAG